MGEYRLAVMDGDGIGPEVVESVRTVLRVANRLEPELELTQVQLPIGLEAYDASGTTLPDTTLAELERCDGWILGPLTTHLYRGAAMPNPSAVLRKRYELFANIRPAKSFTGVSALRSDVDVVVVRENTEGFYADRNLLEGTGELKPDPNTVLSVRVVTRRACERLARAGFELARRRNGHVTLVHKANVLRLGCGLFLETCHQVASEYPEVRVDDFHVDAFAMHLVMRPHDFDVIVTTNLFGDVLSDLSAGLIGGLGLAPGLNAGDGRAMAQAVHGSAPDIAGRGQANPIASVLSVAMLLDWLGSTRSDPAAANIGARLNAAVESVLAAAVVKTPDLGGQARTVDMTRAIVDAFQSA
ncbi:MAG TPA: isocitrate/isopropylmalate dehydrogenase family protein [Nitrolancea sp.]|nr:isocitrate/isopropylmalate dehydrogenase family protein [Nitrolancea sp.]